MQKENLKPWYKKWWGVLVVISFFYLIVPYLVWTKTNWNKWLKVAITGVCVMFFVAIVVDSNNDKQQALALVNQAETLISENKIDAALSALSKSEGLYRVKTKNPAFELKEKTTKLQSPEFLKETLVGMSDNDFALLQKGALQTSFINHPKLDKLFLTKLQESAAQRATYIAEAEELKKQAEASARKEMIEKQFSAWDGSHIKLSQLIKKSMNDPDSYEHVETRYWDMKDHLIVNTTFRGKNAFGGTVTTTVKAKVSLPDESIEILEQY